MSRYDSGAAGAVQGSTGPSPYGGRQTAAPESTPSRGYGRMRE